MNYNVGDKIKFAEEKQRYTVQAANERYLICTKPYNPKRTVIYTIVDLVDNIRGPDNMVFGMGYETREMCAERLEELLDPECCTEISWRNRINLNIEEQA